ncbi:MAG: hypothetical protein HC866_19345 [Leptolyngbyaceae cyanobacterium RU_5_1]|nr:hypothetical protein [Leptolyngbyaceae cyanobacterium RU_5_1]
MSEQQDTFDRLFRILELEAQQLKQRAAEIDHKLKVKIIEARNPASLQQSKLSSEPTSEKHNDSETRSWVDEIKDKEIKR